MIELKNKKNWLKLAQRLSRDCANVLEINISIGIVTLLGREPGTQPDVNLYDLLMEIDAPVGKEFSDMLIETNRSISFILSSEDPEVDRRWLSFKTTRLFESRAGQKILMIVEDQSDQIEEELTSLIQANCY